MLMSRSVKILKYLLLFLLIAIFTGCATARQNPYHRKKSRSSRVSATQLGRNKYYFSNRYQKKLLRGYKKK